MDERITGVMIYYYFVCKRKLWYFCHDIRMETENEDVMLGKILDESSYKKKDKHGNIDDIINKIKRLVVIIPDLNAVIK